MATIATIKADINSGIASLQSALAGLDVMFPANPDKGRVWVAGGSTGANMHAADYSEPDDMIAACSSFGVGLTYSTDGGVSYTNVSLSTGELKGIVYVPWRNAFQIVGKGGVGIIEWSLASGKTTYTLNGNAWHDLTIDESRQLVVAIAQNTGSDTVAVWSDPASVITLTPPTPGNKLQGIAPPFPGSNLFMISCEAGDANRVFMFDGVSSFTQHAAPEFGWKSTARFISDGNFISVSLDGKAMRTSPSGVSALIDIPDGLWHTVKADDGIAVAVNQLGGTQIATLEPFAAGFEAQTAPESDYQGIAKDTTRDRFAVVSLSGNTIYSPPDTSPPPAGLPITQHPTLQSGLLGYWELETDFNDSLGLNNLTNNNVLVVGDFIAANQAYLTGTDYSAIIGSGAGSIGLRINPHTLPFNNTGIIKNYDTQSAGDFMLSVDTAGELRFYEFGSSRFDTTGTPVKVGVDQYVVITWDGSGGAALYYNGTATPITGGNGLSGSWGAEFAIGRIFDSAAYYFDGFINRVGVWSRELTPEEAIDLSNSGNGISYS